MAANPPRHHPAFPLALLVLLLPAVFLLVYINVAAISFRMLGLNGTGAVVLLGASLVGSSINIPLSRRKVVLADPSLRQMPPAIQWVLAVFHYYPPAVTEEVIAINVGGALVPLIFSIYLLTLATTPLLAALLATVVVALVAKILARPIPGVGITVPGFVPPLVAAVAAVLLARALGAAGGAAPVAYISGTMGTLIGADLLNLPLVLRGGLLAAGPARWLPGNQRRTPASQTTHVLSIGGAGIFDGIFLAGIVAAFLA